jgi:hypothetical protein
MRMASHPTIGGVPLVHQVEAPLDGEILHRAAANRLRRTRVSAHRGRLEADLRIPDAD